MSKHTEVMVSPSDRNAWNKIAQPLREHMVDCMNACIGIEDPATTVPELVALARRMRGRCLCQPDRECLSCAALAVLAKTGKQNDPPQPQ